MPIFDNRKKFRGRKAALGSAIISTDGQMTYFAGYCPCGCNSKVGFSPEEAKDFVNHYLVAGETPLQNIIAWPGRAMRRVITVFREANRIAKAGERLM